LQAGASPNFSTITIEVKLRVLPHSFLGILFDAIKIGILSHASMMGLGFVHLNFLKTFALQQQQIFMHLG
jgi:hypothetical protein